MSSMRLSSEPALDESVTEIAKVTAAAENSSGAQAATAVVDAPSSSDATSNSITDAAATVTPPSTAAAPEVSSSVASTMGTKDELVLDFLPEKPVPTGSGIMEMATGIDPPLDAVGLGSWWPPGRVQVMLDYFHSGFDIPWWGSIMIATLCMRACVFPLVIMGQKNMAVLTNNTKEIQEIQDEMTAARQRGDEFESAQAGHKMAQFYKEKGISPFKNMAPLMFQMPFFMSMFMGLRGLSNLPMESMMTGGLGWFVDLTTPDPFYLLPIMTSTSFFLQLKLGVDGASLQSRSPIMKGVMYGMPFLLLPFTMNFSSAVTFYWFFNNLISITQARIVRTKYCRQKLGIPEIIKPPPDEKKGPKKGFRESLRESMDNLKVQNRLIDRQAHDEQVFREIGQAKPKRMYKFDPTKPRPKKR